MKKIFIIFLLFFAPRFVAGMSDVGKKFVGASFSGDLQALKDLEPQLLGTQRASALASALNIAIKMKNYDIVEYLLTIPDIDVKARYAGLTPIHAAVRTGNPAIVNLLLKTNKIDAAIPDNNDTTPLTDAVAQGNLDIVDSLLNESNAKESINLKDYMSGLTALDHAEDITEIEGIAAERIPVIRDNIIQALRSYGAKTRDELTAISGLKNLYEDLQQLYQQLKSLAQKLAAIK